MPKSWFSLALNKADKSAADLSIHDVIGFWGVPASALMEQLRLLGDEVKTINLSIHSPGGEVLDGWAIYNALKMHPANVVVTIKGMAASMASVIMLAGDEVRIPENAYVMIHRVSGGAFGDADDLQQYAKTMEQLEDGIVRAYAERTGLEEEELREMMAVETWMDGREAVEKGFATQLLEPVKATANAGWKARFSAAPKALFDTVKPTNRKPALSTPPEIDMTPEEIEALIKNGLSAALPTALAELKLPTAEEIGQTITDAVTTQTKVITDKLEDANKTITDLTSRVETAEKAVKVAAQMGGGSAVTDLGGGGDDDTPPEAPVIDTKKMNSLQVLAMSRTQKPKK